MNKGYYEVREGVHPQPAWMVNYDAHRALANYRFLARCMGTAATPRIYVSRDCAAVVVSNGSLERVRDPHVRAWRDSFYELDREEFLRRVRDCVAGRRAVVGGPADNAPRAA